MEESIKSKNPLASPKIRVLIVEDEPLTAEDLRLCLEDLFFDVRAVAYNPGKALHILDNEEIDIAILDIDLGSELDGIDIADRINEKYQLPFIYLTAFANHSTVARARRTIPMGYLVKPFDKQSLNAALEIAIYNYAHLIRKKGGINMEKINESIATPLTDREFEILAELHDGKSNKELCAKLFISANTLKTHLSKIYQKMDVQSRLQAVAYMNKILQ